MRRREMSYEDYGMTDEEAKDVIKFCREANEDEKELIKNALSELDPYISSYIFFSLVYGLSYEKLCERNIICRAKNDFYSDRIR